MSLIDKVYTAKDMRAAAKCLFACEVDLKHDNRDISRMLRQAADMMDRADGEAAAKREREAGTEAAQICGEIGEMVGREAVCHQPVTDCHGLNAAAMREACADIAEYAKTATCHTEDAHLLGYLNQIERWAEAALSAPPRNCDVGTEKEQTERFFKFCSPQKCNECKLFTEHTFYECVLRWSQIPYGEGDAK